MDVQETKESKSIKLGGVELEILDQKTSYVPTTSSPIITTKEKEQLLAVAVKNNTAVLLIGETGTGKTSVAREIAYIRKQGYTRINMNGYTTPDDLIGSKSVKNGATYYEDGILTRAMREGHMVVLDEINATPPDCTFIIHGLLDDDRRVVLPNGDIVRPHADFRVMATMNPDYEGTKSLNRAFLDRFGVIINFDIPTPDVEIGIIEQKGGVPKDLATKMVTLAVQARKVYREQKTLTFVSTRSLLQWAELVVKGGLDPRPAYVASIANKARAEEQAGYLDWYSSVFKETPEEEVDAYTITTKKVLDGYEISIRQLRDAAKAKERELDDYKKNNQEALEWKSKAEQALTELTTIKKSVQKLVRSGIMAPDEIAEAGKETA